MLGDYVPGLTELQNVDICVVMGKKPPLLAQTTVGVGRKLHVALHVNAWLHAYVRLATVTNRKSQMYISWEVIKAESKP